MGERCCTFFKKYTLRVIPVSKFLKTFEKIQKKISHPQGIFNVEINLRFRFRTDPSH